MSFERNLILGSGKILATYRGHKSEVTSMSWCPVPVNIFPKNPNNTVGQKKYETVESHTTVDGEGFLLMFFHFFLSLC